MTVLNIRDNDIINGDVIIEYNPRYEHEQAAGIQRVVALVYQQKEKIDVSTMTKFDKVSFMGRRDHANYLNHKINHEKSVIFIATRIQIIFFSVTSLRIRSKIKSQSR